MQLAEIRIVKFKAGHKTVDLVISKDNDCVYVTTSEDLKIISMNSITNGSPTPLSKEVENETILFIKTLNPVMVLGNKYDGVKYKERKLS